MDTFKKITTNEMTIFRTKRILNSKLSKNKTVYFTIPIGTEIKILLSSGKFRPLVNFDGLIVDFSKEKERVEFGVLSSYEGFEAVIIHDGFKYVIEKCFIQTLNRSIDYSQNNFNSDIFKISSLNSNLITPIQVDQLKEFEDYKKEINQ